MNIPKTSKGGMRGKNPITTDSALAQLLEQTKDFQNEEQFKGWKDSFLEVYKTYLDPAGVENANASDDRLVRSLEKLAATVVSVNILVDSEKITTESQTVMGKRALTNMTDQISTAERELQRFMPTMAADEAVVGYNKFELAAVMIEDGFHVYELLKTTKDIIRRLQETVLNDVLPNNKLSIIQFYLRQIQSFCDVMADLGLFGLMEDVMEMYKIRPRSKIEPAQDTPPVSKPVPALKKKTSLPEPEEPQVVELDPDKIYHFRSSFENGYKDPFSGTAPGRSEEPLKDRNGKNEEKGDDGEEDFIVYFDMKTGSIGKIPRQACAAKGFIVMEDGGLEGEIEDPDEKDDLVWKLKKAMKGGATGGTKSPGSITKSPGPAKSYVVTPRKDAKRRIGRSKSSDSDSNFRGLAAPRLDGDDDANDNGSGSKLTPKPEPTKRTAPFKSKSFDSSFFSEQDSDKKPAPFVGIKVKKKDSEMSTGSNNEPTSKKPPGRLSMTTATTTSSSRAPKRTSSQKIVKNPKPSAAGWANASAMAATRREK